MRESGTAPYYAPPNHNRFPDATALARPRRQTRCAGVHRRPHSPTPIACFMMHLLLLPGMDGSGALFAAFITALDNRCKVTVVSYPPQAALSYHELESIARTFVPQNEPYVILGESFSGPIAVSLAATAGPQLRGLILCATFVRNPRPRLGWLRPFLGITPVSKLPPATLSPILFGRWTSATLRDQLTRALKPVSPPALRARLQAVMAVDVSNRLQKIRVPVMYIQAQQDRLVPMQSGELIQRLRPDVQFIKIEAPHLVLQTVPQAAAGLVADFLLELDSEPSSDTTSRLRGNDQALADKTGN